MGATRRLFQMGHASSGSIRYRLDGQDLDRFGIAGEIDAFTFAAADQRAGERCGEGDASVRRVRLVVADDVERPPRAVEREGHPRAESDLVGG